METNKAPNKIYLYLSDRAGEDFDNEWGIMPLGEDSIEYTRTDALIDKACEYIITHIPDMNTLGVSGKIDECIIKDFRTYIKGE